MALASTDAAITVAPGVGIAFIPALVVRGSDVVRARLVRHALRFCAAVPVPAPLVHTAAEVALEEMLVVSAMRLQALAGACRDDRVSDILGASFGVAFPISPSFRVGRCRTAFLVPLVRLLTKTGLI